MLLTNTVKLSPCHRSAVSLSERRPQATHARRSRGAGAGRASRAAADDLDQLIQQKASHPATMEVAKNTIGEALAAPGKAQPKAKP